MRVAQVTSIALRSSQIRARVRARKRSAAIWIFAKAIAFIPFSEVGPSAAHERRAYQQNQPERVWMDFGSRGGPDIGGVALAA
jgi:hypothetical protein